MPGKDRKPACPPDEHSLAITMHKTHRSHEDCTSIHLAQLPRRRRSRSVTKPVRATAKLYSYPDLNPTSMAQPAQDQIRECGSYSPYPNRYPYPPRRRRRSETKPVRAAAGLVKGVGTWVGGRVHPLPMKKDIGGPEGVGPEGVSTAPAAFDAQGPAAEQPPPPPPPFLATPAWARPWNLTQVVPLNEQDSPPAGGGRAAATPAGAAEREAVQAEALSHSPQEAHKVSGLELLGGAAWGCARRRPVAAVRLGRGASLQWWLVAVAEAVAAVAMHPAFCCGHAPCPFNPCLHRTIATCGTLLGAPALLCSLPSHALTRAHTPYLLHRMRSQGQQQQVQVCALVQVRPVGAGLARLACSAGAAWV